MAEKLNVQLCAECQTAPWSLFCDACGCLCSDCSEKIHASRVVSRTHHFTAASPADFSLCENHGFPIQFVCESDKTNICALCEKDGVCQGHKLVETKVIAQQWLEESRAALASLANGERNLHQNLGKIDELSGSLVSVLEANEREVDQACEKLFEAVRARKASLVGVYTAQSDKHCADLTRRREGLVAAQKAAREVKEELARIEALLAATPVTKLIPNDAQRELQAALEAERKTAADVARLLAEAGPEPLALDFEGNFKSLVKGISEVGFFSTNTVPKVRNVKVRGNTVTFDPVPEAIAYEVAFDSLKLQTKPNKTDVGAAAAEDQEHGAEAAPQPTAAGAAANDGNADTGADAEVAGAKGGPGPERSRVLLVRLPKPVAGKPLFAPTSGQGVVLATATVVNVRAMFTSDLRSVWSPDTPYKFEPAAPPPPKATPTPKTPKAVGTPKNAVTPKAAATPKTDAPVAAVNGAAWTPGHGAQAPPTPVTPATAAAAAAAAAVEVPQKLLYLPAVPFETLTFRKLPAEVSIMPDSSLLVADYGGDGFTQQIYSDSSLLVPGTQGASCVLPVSEGPAVLGYVVIVPTPNAENVMRLLPNGDVVWRAKAGTPWAGALHMASRTVYITDQSKSVVHVFNIDTGAPISVFGEGLLKRKPCGIAITSFHTGGERVYVAAGKTVEVFTLSGVHAATLTCQVPFDSLWGLTVSELGLLAVCNFMRKEILVCPLPNPAATGTVELECWASIKVKGQPRSLAMLANRMIIVSLNTPESVVVIQPKP
eukprot:m.10371 g.10371  ORF g.10371 m.10371 type:complete len:773 (-) comp5593_c0_seq1:76-2394(-)